MDRRTDRDKATVRDRETEFKTREKSKIEV